MKGLPMPPRIIDGVAQLKTLVGQEVGVSDWLTINQSLINAFAETTGDTQWIHCDVERARKESPFGKTIAHGFLTLSLLPQLQRQAVTVRGDFKMGINYGLNRVRFTAPVPVDSRIRTRTTLQSMEEFSGGVQVAWGVKVEVEGSEKPALIAEWLGRLYC
jgi:acyl dehydratase